MFLTIVSETVEPVLYGGVVFPPLVADKYGNIRHLTVLTCRAKCFDNALLITEETYNKVVKRVSEAERTIRESSPDDDVDAISSVFRRIEQDCSGVFLDLKIFQPGGPMYDDLVRVTKAYAFYRSGFAYIPGSHAVAATFLVNLSPFNAFVALANSLNRYLPLAFLSGDQMAVSPSRL